jgi:hypothetical protein
MVRKADDDIITNWRNRKEAIRDKCEFENKEGKVHLSQCSLWSVTVLVLCLLGQGCICLPPNPSLASCHIVCFLSSC